MHFLRNSKIRGKHATKPMEAVIAEANELVADGVRELIVVAQDTTYYGMDLYGEPRLAELLRQLDAIEGLDWIRLMYFYPMYVTDELLDVIAGVAEDPAVYRYAVTAYQRLDAAPDGTARDPAETESLIDKLRPAFPI